MAAVLANSTLNYVDRTCSPNVGHFAFTFDEETYGGGNGVTTCNIGATGALTSVNLRTAVLAAINTIAGTSHVLSDLQFNSAYV